jgi:lysophospholipase L1-like esterase
MLLKSFVQGRILFYGDSKTEGAYTYEYRSRLLELLNSGVFSWSESPARISRGGYSLAAMKALTDDDLAARTTPPDYVLFNLGTNETGGGDVPVVAATWKSDLAYMLDALHVKWPSAAVFVARPWQQGYSSQMVDMNDTWIPEVISTRGFCSLGIDEFGILPLDDDGATLTEDGVHPNSAGQDAIAAAWAARIG